MDDVTVGEMNYKGREVQRISRWGGGLWSSVIGHDLKVNGKMKMKK